MSSNNTDDPDVDTFITAMSGVKRLRIDTVEPHLTAPKPRLRGNAGGARQQPDARASATDAADALSDHLDSDAMPIDDLPSNERALEFRRSGIDQRTMRKLQRAQLPIDARLDLHGMNSDQARTQVASLIAHCCETDRRCALIIHGKGHGSAQAGPVLKMRLNGWLRQHHDVLAFTQAPRQLGGAGAAVVLIRKHRGR